MKKPLSIVVVFLVTMTTFIACYKVNRNTEVNSDMQLASEIKPVLQQYLNSQYQLAISKTDDKSVLSLQLNPADRTLVDKISNFKSEFRKLDFAYTEFTSTVTIDSINKDLHGLSVTFHDNYSLTSNQVDNEDPNKFITTEGTFYYSATLKQQEGQWKIDQLSNMFDDPWYINLVPQTGSVGFPNSETSNTANKGTGFTYNPTNAKNYAYTYWNSPNSAYCDFSSGGGDCTNFLSQCLKYGGWTTNSNWFASSGISKCCSGNCIYQPCFACNWASASNFFNYVVNSGRIYSACYADNQLNIGDIIQFATNSSSAVHHSSVVTNKSGTGNSTIIYVTYRNGGVGLPQKDRPSNNISGLHYGWKVKPSAN